MPAVPPSRAPRPLTDAVDQRMEQFNDILLITVAIAGAMALLIAFNATAINADERARENATMFAYGVSVARVLRGSMIEALLIGVLGTAVGIVAGPRPALVDRHRRPCPRPCPTSAHCSRVAPIDLRARGDRRRRSWSPPLRC